MSIFCTFRQPSKQPTQQPTREPSRQPSSQPSRQPSSQPTKQPINHPTGIIKKAFLLIFYAQLLLVNSFFLVLHFQSSRNHKF